MTPSSSIAEKIAREHCGKEVMHFKEKCPLIKEITEAIVQARKEAVEGIKQRNPENDKTAMDMYEDILTRNTQLIGEIKRLKEEMAETINNMNHTSRSVHSCELGMKQARKEAWDEAMQRIEAIKKEHQSLGLLKAADICIETWKKADNHQVSNFRQNRIADGCIESAKAIREEMEK